MALNIRVETVHEKVVHNICENPIKETVKIMHGNTLTIFLAVCAIVGDIQESSFDTPSSPRALPTQANAQLPHGE